MSATLPPAANLERPSDFGEFWQPAEAAPSLASVMPEASAPVQPLTPEQLARRLRLRRAVGGLVLGLLAFTVLATCVYVVKSRAAASSAALSPRPVPVASTESGSALPPASAPAATPVTTLPMSDTDQAMALANTPVATVENLQNWSRLAGQLSDADRQRAEHQLSQLSVKGARSVQEAARLQLALLWRATARRAKAQKVLVSLSRTATDPLVKKFAFDTLRAA